MPRINRVKSARKAQGKCGKCGAEINEGDAYRWIKSRFGPKRCVCANCRFRDSDLTSSDKLAQVYDTRDDAQEEAGRWKGEDVAELRSTLESAAEAVREVAQEYQESADNIMEHFPSGNATSEECEEKSQELEGWADSLDDACQDDFEEEPEGGTESAEAKALRRAEWVEAMRDEAQAALDECPV